MGKRKLTICWLQSGRRPINRMKMLHRFKLPSYMSINKETPCEIEEEDMELLEECERRKLIQIRYKK